MTLRKVLIVDDDATMRIGLKAMIAWREHGYQLLQDAADGYEAIEICRETPPDIVITDMKMPGMDGITFLKELQRKGQHPYIIVLSGYDEFHLVREAMRLGASDYLLKFELEPRCLLESLSSAHGLAQDDTDVDQGMIHEQILRDIISHFYLDETAFSQQMIDAGIVFEQEPVWCLLIKAGELYRFEDVSEENYQTLLFSIRNIAEEIVGDCMHGYYTTGKTGELYVFACLYAQYASTPELVNRTAHRLHNMLLRYLDISCTIGIGCADRSPSSMHRAACEASEAVRRRFLSEDSTVLDWKNVEGQLPQTKEWPDKLRARLVSSLINFEDNMVQEVIAEARTEIDRLPQDAALALLLELYSAVREILERFGKDAATALSCSFRPVEEFMRLRRIDEMQQWLNLLEKDLIGFLRAGRRETGAGSIVAAACEKIEHGFSGDLSVQLVAEELGISPGYLSALMKKHTGRNFTEYVTYVRIQHAKQLLQKTDDKIYAVALATGFTDQYYFSRIFKRITGVTPGDWRKGIRPKEKE